MDPIKDSFKRVKHDMDDLKKEILLLQSQLKENNEMVFEFAEILEDLLKKDHFDTSTDKLQNQTDSAHLSTHDITFKPLKHDISPISTGNEGVSTDRQTDRQTDKSNENSFEDALEILESLDNVKKELRLKFKKLTEQELLVFSTIYLIDEEGGFSSYKILAERLNLTESSIRDYVSRLIKKGIPVEKIKLNNKNIQLKISNNLKKIAPLPTILRLREL